MNYKVSHPTKIVECEIDLPTSKSISNRLLIIKSLCKERFKIDNLSDSEDTIALQMQDVSDIEGVGNGLVMDTGSPHYIEMVDDLKNINVEKKGREIRNSAPFKKEGINVNFVLDAAELQVRSYERGVEAETLSCGTGVVATAIAMHYSNCIEDNLINIKTEGGELSVSFEEFNGSYRNIWLSGEASMVYAGEFEC